jgi:hypothetical protein
MGGKDGATPCGFPASRGQALYVLKARLELKVKLFWLASSE